LDGVAPYVKMGRPILVCFTFFFFGPDVLIYIHKRRASVSAQKLDIYIFTVLLLNNADCKQVFSERSGPRKCLMQFMLLGTFRRNWNLE